MIAAPHSLLTAGHSPLLLAQGPPWLDLPTTVLLLAVLGVLALAALGGEILRRQPDAVINPAVVGAFNARIRAWLLMGAILGAAMLLGLLHDIAGRAAMVLLFFGVSFWALREYITVTPTRVGDHRALFWVFIIFTPLQYLLVGLDVCWVDKHYFYRLYSILIPVYGSLFIPARSALAGDNRRFLERTAKIHLGLLICVYTLSYAPALLDLNILDRNWAPWGGSNAGLLFYLVLLVQFGDVMQFVWDRLMGRRVIAPEIHASKTWEGFLLGVLCTGLLGGALWWVTPFNFGAAFLISLVTAIFGFAGGMTMSAIKRDRGVRDYGTLVQGHAGVLDRIDSLCFAAPVFYHLTRFFYTDQSLAYEILKGGG
jgi:phosphatidate cytidylyltransferase